MRRLSVSVVLAFSGAAIGAASGALACGYHDPSSINRGMLNWAYPDSLHVTSAVWKAQMEGRLARDEQSSSVKALVGYGAAVRNLGLLRDALAAVHRPDDHFSVSVLLIGPVLWARLSPGSGGIDFKPHTVGPEQGDVVVVTDERVVAALVEGHMTSASALESGLFRFYGEAETVGRAASWFQRYQPRLIDQPKSGG